MSLRLSSIITILFFFVGGGFLVIPAEAMPYCGYTMMSIGIILGLWVLFGWLKLRHIKKLLDKRTETRLARADFQAIGMSSPHIDFYFNVRSYLPKRIALTGGKRGELWNPHIEAWQANWSIETEYQRFILPNTDTEIKIRWYIPQGHHSPMSELAFRASDTPPIQHLTFEDMYLEIEASACILEDNVGWLQLPSSPVDINVPPHPTFDRVRQVYERDREL